MRRVEDARKVTVTMKAKLVEAESKHATELERASQRISALESEQKMLKESAIERMSWLSSWKQLRLRVMLT